MGALDIEDVDVIRHTVDDDHALSMIPDNAGDVGIQVVLPGFFNEVPAELRAEDDVQIGL